MATAVPPLMFKSHIFRNHLQKWEPHNNHASPPLLLRLPRTSNRLAHFPAPFLSHNLNLHPLPLQIRRRYILSSPHIPPLLRPCTPLPMSCSSSSSLASTPDPIPPKRIVRKRLMRMLALSDKLNIASLAADDDDEEVCSLTRDLPEDVKEGHVVVHTINGEVRRFIIELNCLSHPEFLKLLEQAQEEFGFKQEGVLTVPCRPGELRKILESMKESDLHGQHG